MSVKIKFSRRKHSKVYDLIVTSKKTLEVLGYYKPEGNWSFLKINLPRLIYWIDCGAICSKRVLKVLAIK